MFKAIDFISRKADVIAYFEQTEVSEFSVAEYCTFCGIPLVVVYQFIAEEFPENRSLCERKIKELREFYGT